ncbi:MAG TPA: hypothetical protein ENL35_08810 [Chloroflexi bacterium]|nr:hypothetical protein [Chloroflexota bacterium]
MQDEPRFDQPLNLEDAENRLHKPWTIPPRGEIMAWSMAAFVWALLIFLWWSVGIVPWSLLLLGLALLLVSLAVRFSRWLEARTSIMINDAGLRYETPLRHMDISWGEIRALWAARSGGGWRIMVEGPHGGFSFRCAVRLSGGSKREIWTGFPLGERIVATILQRANLGEPVRDREAWVFRAVERKQVSP